MLDREQKGGEDLVTQDFKTRQTFCEEPDSRYFRFCGPHVASAIYTHKRFWFLYFLQLFKNVKLHS